MNYLTYILIAGALFVLYKILTARPRPPSGVMLDVNGPGYV